jgi:lysophospholipase L1-like esterase
LVGDSLLNASRGEMTSALSAAGWQPVIHATGGTTITYWATRVQFYEAFDRPDIVVIELGTNDCSPVECVDLAPYIDRIMRSIPISHPVVWLNAQEDVPPFFAAHRDFVNNAIQNARIRWPNLSVVDLSGHFAGHPEWHNPDGLHFNEAGRQEFARFLVDALADHAPE